MPARSFLLLLCAPALLLCACDKQDQAVSDRISVEDAGRQQTSGPAPAEAQGQAFVSTVSESYAFALGSAEAAVSGADRPDVQQFARQLRANIADSREQLSGIAREAHLTLAPGAGSHATELTVLSSTRGPALERIFIDEQLQNLTDLVGLIRAYKNGGDNPQLRAWAEASQGVVNERLLDLQSLKAVIEEQADKKN